MKSCKHPLIPNEYLVYDENSNTLYFIRDKTVTEASLLTLFKLFCRTFFPNEKITSIKILTEQNFQDVFTLQDIKKICTSSSFTGIEIGFSDPVLYIGTTVHKTLKEVDPDLPLEFKTFFMEKAKI